MITRVKKKIHDLRQRPEDERLKVATRFTIIAGIVIIILWLVVFLPLQLSIGQSNDEPRPEQQIKELITGTQSPAPAPAITGTLSPEVRFTSPSPAPTEEPKSIQLLPASENTPSPTATPKR